MLESFFDIYETENFIQKTYFIIEFAELITLLKSTRYGLN